MIPEILSVLQVVDLVHPKVAELVGRWLFLDLLLLLDNVTKIAGLF